MIFLNEEKELKIIQPIVSLYFYADWMFFHQKMLLMFEKVQKNHKDITYFAINVDYFKILCQRFTVDNIPNVIIMKNGTELKRTARILSTKQFIKFFDDIYVIEPTNTGEDYDTE